MATIKEIAARLNITPAAVSYALNGRKEKVSAATLQRVLETAQAMGYQPHAAARALRTGRHQAVAVLIRTPESPYYAQILHYLIQEVLAHSYQIIIQQAERPEDERQPQQADLSWRTVLQPSVDAYFIVDAPYTAIALREVQQGRSRPKTVVSLGVFHDTNGDYVGIDLSQGTMEAVAHLAAIGCRRIAYLTDTGTYSLNETRSVAYVRAMEAAGRRPEFIVSPEQSRQAAYQTAREHFNGTDRPDGLLCVNDEMALGVKRALWDLGLHVPVDVALVGCDGIPEAEYANPALTTLVQPIEEMSRLAWTFLEQRRDHPEIPSQQALLTAPLTIRGSSQKPASGSTKNFPSEAYSPVDK